MKDESFITYSVVVPLSDEQESVPPLYIRLTEVMDSTGEPYELVFVDDGSRDDTYKVLLDIYEHDRRVNVLRLRRSFGPATALQAGLDFASGVVLITMDGGLRNNPEDIPLFLAKLEEGYELVSGCRVTREDDGLWRQLVRRLASGFITRLTGIRLRDLGSTFRAYRREDFGTTSTGQPYRSLLALASSAGARIAEVPIQGAAPKSEKSIGEIRQLTRALFDLLIVKFLLNSSRRPLRLLGLTGVAASLLGAAICAVLTLGKVFLGTPVFERHGFLLLLGIACFLGGLQLIGISMLWALLGHAAGESQNKPVYALREIKSRREAGDSAESARPSGSSER